jgi:predicted lactoylglutathione lyase
MEKSIKFYRDSLGFQTKETRDNPGVIFFNTFGTKFELYPLDLLTKGVSSTSNTTGQGFNGVTLAYCVKSVQEVHDTIELARKAGATIVKEPHMEGWGCGAYFTDPDGYYWEVSYLGDDLLFDENDMFIEIGTY